MYGAESDNGNWDHMLDGTIESLFNNANAEEPGELGKLDNQHQLRTSSSMLAGAEWLEADGIQQMNQRVTSMSAALDEMEWDRRKCKSSLGDCIHQFERLKAGTSLWMCRLDLLQQAISYDPDMVKMGRSNDEGDLHVMMNQSQQMIRPEKRGDVDREEEEEKADGRNSSSLHLASFQGPDNGEILSRIDLLKKNAVSVSSGNQPQRDEAQQQQQPSHVVPPPPCSLYNFSSSRMVTMSPPATTATKAPGMSSSSSGQQRQRAVTSTASSSLARGGGGGEREADENRAKLPLPKLLLPSSRQVKLPETLEATSLLETETG
ncbi:uncharacterized protein LOC124337070 isoform X2 [Daphnia pulicaria]|uniref:uncharacterized protein LOC124337070 isoform X2 n=1 Tax=Daphnia pulicaria TaxID=35523 RepID=UPI001EEB7D7D|nr:uncharacterized protein LOC124337070 isoform X2 [Daphnia pulicaria]